MDVFRTKIARFLSGAPSQQHKKPFLNADSAKNGIHCRRSVVY